MNSQLEQQKNIQAVFNNFDSDHSGTIEISEIRSIAKELGEDVSQDQLKEIIKQLDINNDGKISLEQFKYWWLHGVKGKLKNLVYLKAKSMKMTNFFLSKLQDTGAKSSEPTKNLKADKVDIKIGVGQLDLGNLGMDMKLGVFYRGTRENERRTRLKQKITWLNQQSTNIAFIMKSSDPQKAQKELSQFIKKLLQVLPIPIQDLQDNPFVALKIKAVGVNLIVHIQFKQILNQIVAGPLTLIDSTSSNYSQDFYFSGQFWIKSKFTVEDLMKDKQIVETLLKGFQFHVVGQVPGSLSKKCRELLQTKAVEPNSFNFFIILLKSLKVNIKLKSPKMFDKFIQKLGIKDILSELPAFSDTIELLSQLLGAQQLKKDNSPLHLVYSILTFLKQHVKSKIQIYVQSKQVLVELFTEIPNASRLFQAFFNQV